VRQCWADVARGTRLTAACGDLTDTFDLFRYLENFMGATQMSHRRGGGFDVENGAAGRGRIDLGKFNWIGACADRLAALRPGLGLANARASALRMWPEVGHFDPGIAAELEHESWPMDD
jgi:hypothetical protein